MAACPSSARRAQRAGRGRRNARQQDRDGGRTCRRDHGDEPERPPPATQRAEKRTERDACDERYGHAAEHERDSAAADGRLAELYASRQRDRRVQCGAATA